MMKTREEKDSMGTIHVPESAYYGSQTQRALENFQFSDLRFPLAFIYTLALVKKSAALVNGQLGVLSGEMADVIAKVAQEIMEGKFDDQFGLDIFQTGSGTSTNMNMNEVIASRANEIMKGQKGGRSPVHPNDHVNTGQSSNDVIPTTIHVTSLRLIVDDLIPAMRQLHQSLWQKATEFRTVKKIGRTHLQDAVPLTLGQEFSGYARQVELGIGRLETVGKRMLELPIGGTAVGTGINSHPDFAVGVVQKISAETGLGFSEAENHFEAQGARDAVVETSGVLKTIAVSITKIANDIRWLSSGPRCGIGEISLPSLQPGSSIMPGKVNPVIPEAVIQIAAQVCGNDTTITIAGQSGNFELNVMMPVMAYNLIQSIMLLSRAASQFAEKCIDGIQANTERTGAYIEKSLAMATALIPMVGYDKAAEIAKKAAKTGKTVREVAGEEGITMP